MASAKKQDALTLLEVLETAAYEARLVGGCVRDEMLGLEPKDFDVTTAATPDQMLALFKKKRLRCLLHGKEHGTITVLMKHGPVEVTTLREDVNTDGRRAEVAFHSDFKTDACRRDFTINAMSQNRKGELFDYFEGKKHLAEKHLVFVGDPVTRIREDYLRILRFFRFKARFLMKSDAPTLEAIRSEVIGLEKVSKERITSEIDGIFKSKELSSTLEEMASTGVLAFVFPDYALVKEKERSEIARCVQTLAGLASEWRSQARIAALFWFMGPKKKLADEEIHLHLSNKEKALISTLIEAAEALEGVKPGLADRLLFVEQFDGKEEKLFLNVVVPFLKAVYEGSPSLLKTLDSLVDAESTFGERRRPIPLEGRELMQELGIAAGPLVGEALRALRYAFLEGEWETKEEAKEWLRRNFGG